MRRALITLLLCAFLSACGPTSRADVLLILASGHTQGYLENCGCSGGQIGGLARRSAYLQLARDEAARGRTGEPQPAAPQTGRPAGADAPKASAGSVDPLPRVETLLIDCGSFVQRGDGLRELESAAVVEAMGLLDYQAVGLGQAEIEFEQPALLALLRRADLPYTCANLSFETPRKGENKSAELAALLRPYLVVRRPSGLRVGIVHVIDVSSVYREGRLEAGYRLSEPVAAVREVLAKHRHEADLWILSVNCMKFTPLDPAAMAALPGIDIILGIDVAALQRQRERDRRRQEFGAAKPPASSMPEARPSSQEGAFQMGRPMEKGKELLALAWPLKRRAESAPPVPWRIYIKEGVTPDERIEAISAALQPRREEYELTLARRALELRSQDREHPWYVGHETCAQCHSDIAAKLADSKHMHAYETLAARGRQTTSCAKCHNLGYNRPSGWNAIEDREHESWVLRNVQCENCHGPGEYHVLLQTGQPVPEDLRRRGRNEQGLIPASAATCVVCHDHENSPRFQFLTYWPKIAHGQPKD